MRHGIWNAWILWAALVLAGPAAWPQNSLLREIERSFVQLNETVGPSVVNIEVQVAEARDGASMEDMFRYFGVPTPDGEAPAPAPRPYGTGSGFVYDAQGHIVTNNHVVQDADKILVRFRNGEEYDAQVVGVDPETDLAVIRINAGKPLPVARLGDSDNLRVGQFAIAIGSSRGFEGSVSFGHISALGREGLQGLAIQGLTFQNLIQTDAAINLGNSGGPLCNIDGEVIGINTAIIWGANSIGFAIPVNQAKNVAPALIARGKVTRGYLGVRIEDAQRYQEALDLPDGSGAIVSWVEPGSPADTADLQVYDVIRRVDAQVIADATHLMRTISSYKPSDRVELEIVRDNAMVQVSVQLEERRLTDVQPEREQYVLGMRLRPLTADIREQLRIEESLEGVFVAEVKSGTPAETAGLAAGDVLMEVNRKPVTSPGDVFELLTQAEGGSKFLIRYKRVSQEPDITLLEMPE